MIQQFSFALLLGVLWFSNALAQEVNLPSGIHLLFVFGTEEKKVEPVIREAQKRVQHLLEVTGVNPDSESFQKEPSQGMRIKRVKPDSVIILQGRDASPKEILRVCQELAQKAGKDGVVFVYFVCRSAVNGDEQILYPLAISETELGAPLPRKEVFAAIAQNPHRLTALFTDGCHNEIIHDEGCEMSSMIQESGRFAHTFSAFLAYGRGIIDLAAADFSKNEVPLGSVALGPYFSNVFCNFMDQIVEDKKQFNIEGLVNDLQHELNLHYGNDYGTQEKAQGKQSLKLNADSRVTRE